MVCVIVEMAPFGNVVFVTNVYVEVVDGVEGGGVGVSGGRGVGESGKVVHEVENNVIGWLIVVVTMPSEAMVTTDVLPVSHTVVSGEEVLEVHWDVPGMVSTSVIVVGLQVLEGGTALELVTHALVVMTVVEVVGGKVVMEVI